MFYSATKGTRLRNMGYVFRGNVSRRLTRYALERSLHDDDYRLRSIAALPLLNILWTRRGARVHRSVFVWRVVISVITFLFFVIPSFSFPRKVIGIGCRTVVARMTDRSDFGWNCSILKVFSKFFSGERFISFFFIRYLLTFLFKSNCENRISLRQNRVFSSKMNFSFVRYFLIIFDTLVNFKRFFLHHVPVILFRYHGIMREHERLTLFRFFYKIKYHIPTLSPRLISKNRATVFLIEFSPLSSKRFSLQPLTLFFSTLEILHLSIDRPVKWRVISNSITVHVQWILYAEGTRLLWDERKKERERERLIKNLDERSIYGNKPVGRGITRLWKECTVKIYGGIAAKWRWNEVFKGNWNVWRRKLLRGGYYSSINLSLNC